MSVYGAFTMAPSFSSQLRAAERHLIKVDSKLASVIRRVGHCTLERETHFEPFQALVSAIAHQQLTGKAAQTILGRVKDRLGKGDWPTAKKVSAARLETLRACGLSNAKSLAFKDLAAKTLSGHVPQASELHQMSDAEIIERLTDVRGIGQWTVEMMLMFRLGRLDVMPADDYGVRKGYTKLFRKRSLIERKQLLSLSEPWRPYRSVASWYLWRVLELE